MSLTDREKRFVAEYCIDLNAAAAARRAGYSESYAGSARLIQRPDIVAAIRAHDAPALERASVTAERVIREAARVAFADPRRFARPDGTLHALHELDEETAAAIASLTIDERPDGRRFLRLRLHDKMAALVLLGRHLGLFTDRLELTVGDAIVADMDAARPRLS